MKYIKFFLIGMYLGFVLTKTEALSWFRIQEMFHFHSIHMYGVIGSAVLTGVIGLFIIGTLKLKSFTGERIKLIAKQSHTGLLPGGIIFGLGWSLTGASPASMFALLGNGMWIMLIGIFSAIVGTFVYGSIKNQKPK